MRRAALAALLLLSPLAVPARLAGQGAAAEATLLSLEDRRSYEAGVFAPLLSGPDAGLRRRAALAAGRIRDARAVPPLVRLLGDRDTSVAATAAFALGQIGDTTAVAALAALLGVDRVGPAPTVAAEAADALGKLRSASARAALEGFLGAAPTSGRGVREAVGSALLAVWKFPRPADAAPIARWLSNPDTAIAWRAAYALARRPDAAAAAALAPHAGARSPLVRSFALRALTASLVDSAGLDRSRVLSSVIAAARDPDHAVSVSAIRTLGSYDAPEAVAELRRLLGENDPYRSITAAESLMRLGPRALDAAGDLARAVRDAARPVALRTTALAALTRVSAPAARPILSDLAASPEWRLRAAAARAAAAIGEQTILGRLTVDRDARVVGAAVEAAVEAAGDSAATIRPLLVTALGHADPIVRYNALQGFVRLADPSDVPLLLDAYDRARRDSVLNDAALAAVEALGAISRKNSGAAARSFFTRFPRSTDYLVRLAAVRAFGDSAAGAGWGAPLPIENALTPAAAESVLREPLPRRARIVTNRGSIVLELFADQAPLTVRSFAALARRRYFDGQEWPRVVPNFVIQGGDPRGDTSGGPGYAIRDEINRERYLSGTLGMALSGPDTGGSQWFITHSPQPHLDGTYTVFGRVLDGMETVNAVIPGDRIERIEIIP